MPVVFVYLGLGSNQGEREAQLRWALVELRSVGEVQAVSPLYETSPWGVEGQRDYVNLCCSVLTELSPAELSRQTQSIEVRAGRGPHAHWVARSLDIDILVYGQEVIRTPELTVPHRWLASRAFVLVPLADIAPELHVPGFGASVQQLLAALPRSPGDVRPLGQAPPDA